MRLCVHPYALWWRVVWVWALQYLDRHEALRVDVDRSARLAGYHVLSARAAVAPAAARAAPRFAGQCAAPVYYRSCNRPTSS